jgi:choline dehydrogenase-like flavoprotein
MGFMEPNALNGRYDVIVVGSGAAGGQAAYTLALEGARVLMLEAGREYVPETETAMFKTPDQAPLGGAGTPDEPFGFYDATIDGGWQVPGGPYVQSGDDPGGQFAWWRARMLGGAYESLGPHLSSQWPVRLQAVLARRSGIRLAALV